MADLVADDNGLSSFSPSTWKPTGCSTTKSVALTSVLSGVVAGLLSSTGGFGSSVATTSALKAGSQMLLAAASPILTAGRALPLVYNVLRIAYGLPVNLTHTSTGTGTGDLVCWAGGWVCPGGVDMCRSEKGLGRTQRSSGLSPQAEQPNATAQPEVVHLSRASPGRLVHRSVLCRCGLRARSNCTGCPHQLACAPGNCPRGVVLGADALRLAHATCLQTSSQSR